jgi:hypothetical protein
MTVHETPHCSFCGKAAAEALVLIAGTGCFICDDCTKCCVEIVEEHRFRADLDAMRKVVREEVAAALVAHDQAAGSTARLIESITAPGDLGPVTVEERR